MRNLCQITWSGAVACRKRMKPVQSGEEERSRIDPMRQRVMIIRLNHRVP